MVEILKNDLENLYRQKMLTTYEIADVYNCCQGTIWKRLEKYRIKRLPNGRRSLIIPKYKLKNLFVKQRLSSRKIAKIYGCAYSAIDYKIKDYGLPTKTLVASHITTLRKNFDGDNADKAYLIGFAVGDLRVRKRHANSETISIDCGSTKREQIDLIFKLFNPYGKVWISKPNKRGATQIECFLNESFNFLLKKRTSIDRWILEDKKCFFAFLAGFTDAEGCISIDRRRNQAYYALGNYNRIILNQIRNYLINIFSCPKLIKSKIKGRLCFGKYFHNQNYWQLRIYKKNSLMILFRLINPYLKHSQRRKDMENAQKNIILRNKLFHRVNRTK